MEKGFYVVVALVTLVAFFFLLQTEVEDTFLPEPEQAWVAIELGGPDGDGVARVAPVEVPAGTPFTLHAVVGARSRGGELVYYTEATAVEIGGERIPAAALETWNRSRTVKLRWYTVEGRTPYQRLDLENGAREFEMREFQRTEWPLAWQVPGELDADNDDHLEPDRREGAQRFGTQRFQVRFQLYQRSDDLVPSVSIPSWGVDELRDHIDGFPSVTAVLPGALAPASRVFGLTQLDPPPRPDAATADAETLAAYDRDAARVAQQIAQLAEHRVAFSRLTVLRDQVAGAGRQYSDLTWTELDLGSAPPWVAEGETNPAAAPAVQAGDLLRVGDRVVVAYADRGMDGTLDHEDLCFDFVQGAAVRTLSDVYSGDRLTLEWADLTP